MRIAPMFGLPLLALLLCGGPVATTPASAEVRAPQPDASSAWRAGPYAGQRIRCAGSAMCAWKRIPDEGAGGFRSGRSTREDLLEFLRGLPPHLHRLLPPDYERLLQER
jgi:hypothetical protein